MYSKAAEAQILASYYFKCKLKAVPSDYRPKEEDLPALIVYKDKGTFTYEGEWELPHENCLLIGQMEMISYFEPIRFIVN